MHNCLSCVAVSSSGVNTISSASHWGEALSKKENAMSDTPVFIGGLNDLPETIPISMFPQINANINTPKPEPKKPQACDPGKKPTNWRAAHDDIARKFIALVSERKQLSDLLLLECKRLEEMGFTCEHGPLETCQHYINIKSVATGVPAVYGPPLDTLSNDAMRIVKQYTLRPQHNRIEMILECGHVCELAQDEADLLDERPSKGSVIKCGVCVEMLKARGQYEDA